MADHNKTEQATPHRRERARREGQIPRSREFPSAMALSGTGLVLCWQARSMFIQWNHLLRRSLEASPTASLSIVSPALLFGSSELLRAVTPAISAGFVFAIGAGLAQGGLVVSTEALIPRFSRLLPSHRLRQMFSLSGLSAILRSLLPFLAILSIGIEALEAHWNQMIHASYLSLPAFAKLLLNIILDIGWKSAAILLAWSAVDYFLVWRKHEGDLRMTRQELRDDLKETEGNPETKARVRRIQRNQHRRKMLSATETATVVITNPTHYAVALRYEIDMDAPVAVAKGADLLAIRIREVARWHGIPVMENPPLAQALYRSLDVGQAIPAKLYAAVAEILVMVFRAQQQVRKSAEQFHERREHS